MPSPADPRERRRLAPFATALGLSGALWGLALLRWHTFLASYDVAYFGQAAWLIGRGERPFVSIRGLHLLGDHAAFVFWPMAWVASVLPTVPALLLVQSAALGLGAVPLWWVGRHLARLPVPMCAALLAAYALYPALGNVALFDFHPETVAVPGLLFAVWFGLTRKRLPYAAAVAVVLLAREDLAVPVFFLGVLLLTDGDRRGGLATMVSAAVWAVVDFAVVLPHFAEGLLVQGSRFAHYGDTLGEATWYMATHPLEVGGDFATRANAKVLAGLFLPVLCLPFLAPRHLLPGLPLQLAYLLTNVPAAHTITAHYTVSTIPFVLVATAFALARLPRIRLVPVALVAASLAGFLVAGTASPLREPWQWAARDRVDGARLAAARLVADGAPLAATIRVLPLVAERREAYAFPAPFAGYLPDDAAPARLAARQGRVRWVVVDTVAEGQYTPIESWWEGQLPGLGFSRVFERDGIVVWRR